jgi:hypothetical protein
MTHAPLKKAANAAAASLALLAILGIAEGCTATASAGPPQQSGPTCDVDGTVTCLDGVGYSCTGGDTPEESNSSLLCSEGTAGNAGSTLYCCLTSSSDTTCGDDPTVSCPGGGFGFSCANASEAPNVAYPSLTCSSPVPGNAGSATYCCTD